jgi:hypothetical protein
LTVYTKENLEYWRVHLPQFRYEPSGKLISARPNWTDEEISAWLDHKHQADKDEEEDLVGRFSEVTIAGRRLPEWPAWQGALREENQEISKNYTR